MDSTTRLLYKDFVTIIQNSKLNIKSKAFSKASVLQYSFSITQPWRPILKSDHSLTFILLHLNIISSSMKHYTLPSGHFGDHTHLDCSLARATFQDERSRSFLSATCTVIARTKTLLRAFCFIEKKNELRGDQEVLSSPELSVWSRPALLLGRLPVGPGWPWAQQ